MSNEKEILNPVERWGQLFAIAGILFVAAFLFFHQIANTGFFTADFGEQEKLALYGPLMLSLAAPVAKLFSGLRNPGRFFEAATGFALAAGSYYLIQVFPFDFSHLADPLPAFLRWPIAWLRDPIARIILWIQVFAGALSGVTNGLQFLARLGDE